MSERAQTPAVWITEQTYRIEWLEEWRAETKEPDLVQVLDAEIAEIRRIRDDFIEFAEQAYALNGESR